MKKLNRAVWTGAIIGGVYALIVVIGLIFGYRLGDFPIFFPISMTSYIFIVPLFFLFFLTDIIYSQFFGIPIFDLTFTVLNVPLWILIGALVGKLAGKLIQKIRVKENPKKK